VTGHWKDDDDLPPLREAPADDGRTGAGHGAGSGRSGNLDLTQPQEDGDTDDEEQEEAEADAGPPLDEATAGGPGPWPCGACSAAGPLCRHAAALRGHLECLRTGLCMEVHELDARGRSPLFYAAASGRPACATLCLEVRPDWAATMDGEGNGPLSAACASGHTDMASLLLEWGADPACASNKGLTPAHVAKTAAVLDVLGQHGAPLEARDASGRTPLFVACALGRAGAASMLLEMDTTMTLLEAADERGDRPLLAAAANGHRSVVRLLLGHGAEWAGANGRGLIAEDAARVNGHQAVYRLLRRVRVADETAAEQGTATAYGAKLLTPTPTVGPVPPGGDLFSDEAVRVASKGGGSQPLPGQTAGGAGAEAEAGVDWSGVVLASSGPWAVFWDPTHSAVYYVYGPTGQSQWEPPADEHGPALASALHQEA